MFAHETVPKHPFDFTEPVSASTSTASAVPRLKLGYLRVQRIVSFLPGMEVNVAGGIENV